MSKIQGAGIKNSTEIVAAGGTIAQLPTDDQQYVTALGINKTMKQAIEDGDLSGGGNAPLVTIVKNTSNLSFTNPNPVIWTSIIQNPRSSYNSSNGQYTVSQSGVLTVGVSGITSTGGRNMYVYVNGSFYQGIASFQNTAIFSNSVEIPVTTGDVITIIPDSNDSFVYSAGSFIPYAWFNLIPSGGVGSLITAKSYISDTATPTNVTGNFVYFASGSVVNSSSNDIEITNDGTNGIKVIAKKSGAITLITNLCNSNSADYVRIYKNGSQYVDVANSVVSYNQNANQNIGSHTFTDIAQAGDFYQIHIDVSNLSTLLGAYSVSALLIGGSAIASKQYVKARQTGTGYYLTTTPTKVVFNAVDINDNSIYSSGTITTKRIGKIKINFNRNYTGGSSAQAIFEIYKNGSSVYVWDQDDNTRVNATSGMQIFECAVNDTWEIYEHASAGSVVFIDPANSSYWNVLNVEVE